MGGLSVPPERRNRPHAQGMGAAAAGVHDRPVHLPCAGRSALLSDGAPPAPVQFFRADDLPLFDGAHSRAGSFFQTVLRARRSAGAAVSRRGRHPLVAFAPLLAPRAAERRPCAKASCSAWQTLSRRGGLTEGLGVFGLCLTLLTGALAANRLFGANYLFLRALPFPIPMWQTLSPSGRAGCYLLLSVPLSFAPLHFKRRHVV